MAAGRRKIDGAIAAAVLYPFAIVAICRQRRRKKPGAICRLDDYVRHASGSARGARPVFDTFVALWGKDTGSLSSITSHLPFGGSELSLRKKFRLFFTVGIIVLLLGGAKAIVHYFEFEFLDLNGLVTSGIGGAIFIIGFLLSSILKDYKEAEQLPTTLRTAIEAIDGDLECFARTNERFDLREA